MPGPIQTKTIQVVLNADGTLKCVPHVTRIKPGGALVWSGPPHSGRIRGRIPPSLVPNPLQHTFTNAELHAFGPQLQQGALPFETTSWEVVTGAVQPNATIRVNANAPNMSVYKYDVTVPGHPTLDPVIIVDENAPEP